MESKKRGSELPVVEEQAASTRCTRRNAITGLATAVAAGPLVLSGCTPRTLRVGGDDAGSGPPPPTGDAGTSPPPPGHDAGGGGSSCDQTVNLCIDLSDSTNQMLLGSVGGAGTVRAMNGDTIIIVHTAASTFKALSAVCTHAGCIVNYQQSQNDLYCACHGSAFGMDGHVISGPAQYYGPLRTYRTSLDGNTLTVFLG